jgi:tetratricopeptide (TPR) repeat protein
VLDAGDLETSVRSVFSWSYQHLSPPAARMFRLLGVHPGPDTALPATASLAGMSLGQAQRATQELTRTHLIRERVPGRFDFHDLLRTYAADQTHALDTDADRRAAVLRALDHYLLTAHSADQMLYPTRDPLALAPPQPGVIPVKFADRAQALAWFHAEYPVLLAIAALGAEAGFDNHAWQIPWTLVDFIDRHGHWHDWVATQHTALAAAQRLDSLDGQAAAHRSLGRAYTRLNSYIDAGIHLRRALDLYRACGDGAGQAHVHLGLAQISEQRQQYDDALAGAQHALDLFRELDHHGGQAKALNNTGWYHARLGNYYQALVRCQQALTLERKLGNHPGEANTWDSLGYAHHHLGHHAQAITCYRQALALYCELGDPYEEACVLIHLGDTQRTTGETGAARESWQQALAILNDLHHPGAGELLDKLHQLDYPGTRSLCG